jgi:hypothetical protein
MSRFIPGPFCSLQLSRGTGGLATLAVTRCWGDRRISRLQDAQTTTRKITFLTEELPRARAARSAPGP